MILTVFWLWAVIQLTSSLEVIIPSDVYEFARGGDAVIPCKFTPEETEENPTLFITWTAKPDNIDDPDIGVLTYFDLASTTQLDVDPEYGARASIQMDIKNGWANLTLRAVTSNENRIFQCEVKIPGDTEGEHSATTSVVVLVTPSEPICAIQGKAEFYQNISLTCRSEEGMPTPLYRWQSYDSNNNPRPHPPKSTEANGVLKLYNISTENSGYYLCESSNKIGSSSCNLTLAVARMSMNIGSTAGIIGGCAAGLVLLIIILVCCCRRCQKKEKSEEYAMGAPEGEEYTDKEPRELEERKDERPDNRSGREDRSDRYDDRQDDRYDDRRSDRYDDRRADRRSDYDDRRSDYDDRRSDYDDRRSERYDDRRSDRYDDRRDDRRSDYDDRRSDYDDRRNERYDDRRSDRYDDRRDR